MTSHTIDPARAAFLAERRRGIGGSDVAAALGLDPRKTPAQLWLEKRGQDQQPIKNPAALRRGHFLEDAVAARYADVIRVQSIEKQVHHEAGEHGWMRGNQDLRVIDGEGRKRCVEIKTCRRSVWRSEWGDPWSDEVPDRALCQGLWYGHLDDADIVDFALVVIPDDPDQVIGCTAEEVAEVSDFHIYQAERNATTEAQILRLARSFWDMVLAGVPPSPTGADDVQSLWPTHDPEKSVEVTREAADLIARYRKVTEKLRELDGAKRVLRDALAVMIGEGEAVTYKGKPLVTFKRVKRAAYSVPEGESRRFHVTKHWKPFAEKQIPESPEPEENQTDA